MIQIKILKFLELLKASPNLFKIKESFLRQSIFSSNFKLLYSLNYLILKELKIKIKKKKAFQNESHQSVQR